MRKITLTLCALCTGLFAMAQKTTVTYFSPNVVRVVKTPTDAPVDHKSVVVTATPQSNAKPNIIVEQAEDGTLTFKDKKGNVLMREGQATFTPIAEGIDAGRYSVAQAFALEADEPIYGIGLLQNGKMNQRGENRLMMQSNLEDYAHFFQSQKGYGIYWDNYSPTRISDDGTMLSLTSQVGELMDYYFMYGGDADGVIREMRWLTGKVPMLPLWTYGFHQSRERYKSEKEILSVVDTYRKTGVPFDCVIQDWQYWGNNYLWNAMDFLNDEFSHPQQMIDHIHGQNARMMISIWASFGPQTLQYREMEPKGMLFNFETWPQSGLPAWPPNMDFPSGVRVYDCYNAEARDIYWKYLSKMHKMGIDGWWMDSTDPDHHSYKESDLDVPSAMGSYRSVRNIFPLMCVEGVHDNQLKADASKRPFILTRSYFAGQQRTGANTWSGDVSSSWDSFRKQVPICLNYTLTANPNVNTDIGGFFANSYNKSWNDNSATHNPLFQELYTRWMQFGLFCPMMRSHGTEVVRELYHFGKPGEPIYDALLGAVKTRYRLLPYIYSTSWQVSRNDDSFMRALVMDFKDDPKVWNNNREFMFGRSLLIAPVVNALYTPETANVTDELSGWDKNKKSLYQEGFKVDWNVTKQWNVYLPATQGGWYDFYTNRHFDAPFDGKVDLTIATSPVFVRAGSIVPIGPDVQYSNEKPWDDLEVIVYPGADGTFILYEDAFDGFGYEKGECTEIPMTWNDRSRTLTIGRRKGTYPGMIAKRQFRVRLLDGSLRTVAYTGKAVSVKL